MTDSKTYLNVPYQEKDSAKALGAKWDAINKKWYIPANIDITLFAKWYIGAVESSTASKTRNLSPKSNLARNNEVVDGITYPEDKNFIAYSGDEPPWN